MSVLKGMSEEAAAAHVRACFGTSSGQVVWEILRTLCFMDPRSDPQPIETAEQATSRIGLVNLFRKLEHYRTKPATQEIDDGD